MTPLISAVTLAALGAGLIGLFAALMHRTASRRAVPDADPLDAGSGAVLAGVNADSGGDAGSSD